MKTLLLTIAIILLDVTANAQFTKASLQATGLTCSMCSNAVNKALLEVPFVKSVIADVKNSTFNIVFKQGETIQIDELRKAVEDAGFSVGNLKITGDFKNVKVENDKHTRLGDAVFHFINVTKQVLNGEKTVMIIDQTFLTEIQFKKLRRVTNAGCILNGKTASCYGKDGDAVNVRVYHVTI